MIGQTLTFTTEWHQDREAQDVVIDRDIRRHAKENSIIFTYLMESERGVLEEIYIKDHPIKQAAKALKKSPKEIEALKYRIRRVYYLEKARHEIMEKLREHGHRRLTDREIYIVECLCGFDKACFDKGPMGRRKYLREIGKDLGISSARVNGLYAKARRTLQKKHDGRLLPSRILKLPTVSFSYHKKMGVELITIFAKSGTKRLEWVHPKGKADEGWFLSWSVPLTVPFEETEALKKFAEEKLSSWFDQLKSHIQGELNNGN